jgi:hypothetical protein
MSKAADRVLGVHGFVILHFWQRIEVSQGDQRTRFDPRFQQ